jgi:hypothetical protein
VVARGPKLGARRVDSRVLVGLSAAPKASKRDVGDGDAMADEGAVKPGLFGPNNRGAGVSVGMSSV